MTEQETTTTRPQPLPVDPAGIPEVLKQRPQWVVWQYVRRNDDWTKVPYIAGGGGRASTTDLMTWRSFKDALDAFQTGRYDGIGFVLCSGDPYAGVDLDKCRNLETGELEEWAAEIVQEFGGYAEASPSGEGVHIIVRGKAPNKKRGKVEAYSTERYFTITGQVL
jgi:putative DNA primase/helicase